jgi:hypothetical protein
MAQRHWIGDSRSGDVCLLHRSCDIAILETVSDSMARVLFCLAQTDDVGGVRARSIPVSLFKTYGYGIDKAVISCFVAQYG